MRPNWLQLSETWEKREISCAGSPTCELASPRPPVSATQRRALHTATPPKHADAYRGEAVLLRHMRYGLVDVQPPRYTHADAYEREAASLQHMRQGLLAGTPPHKARSPSFLNKRVSHAFECHNNIHSLRVRSGGPHARASEARHVGHCVLVASHARMQASWKWCLRPPSRPRWNGSRSNISTSRLLLPSHIRDAFQFASGR